MKCKSLSLKLKFLSLLLCLVMIFAAIQVPAVFGAQLQNLLSNGTFDTDVAGWKNSNSGWGTLEWDSSIQAMKFTKTSASSGPAVYSDVIKVSKGAGVQLSYDYKTSVALTGTATSVYLYAYTSEFVNNKGTTVFKPTGSNYNYEFVNTKTDWQTNELTYTLPEDCEYVQVQIAFRGAVAANTVLSLDNICLYEVNEDYVLNKISVALADGNQADFDTWVGDSTLGIQNLDSTKYTDYFLELKKEDEITKTVIQNVVNSFMFTLPESIIPNGTFDTDVSGWSVYTSAWGSITWDSENECADFKKLSASSGPEMYTNAIKVESGDRLYLNYDYKTSVAITDVNKTFSVYMFAYTSDFVSSKGTTTFLPTGSVCAGEFVLSTTEWQTKQFSYTVPEGCEYVQVRFAFRGGAVQNIVLSLDNISLYRVDENYVLNEIRTSLNNEDQELFDTWIGDSALGIKNLDESKYSDYFTALKTEDLITKEAIQTVVDSFVYSPKSFIPNGTFDEGVAGWGLYTSSYGKITWDSENKLAVFEKISSSSGPEMYTEAIKVSKGARVHLSYDYKTSVALSGVATSAYIFAYTSDFIAGKSTTLFTPTGSNCSGEFVDTKTDWQTKELTYTLPADCEYVQVRIAFRGAVAANTVLSIDNVKLFVIDENYVINEIKNSVDNDNQTLFDAWIVDSALGIENLNADLYTDYFEALKAETSITKEVIQAVVNSFVTEGPASILPNGKFDKNINGWTSNNSTLAWDNTEKAIKMTKQSTNNEFWSAKLPVSEGQEVYFEYDIKTSAALTGMATAFIYAYNDSGASQYTYEFVDTTTDWISKKLSYTVPTGYTSIQIRFSFRGATPAGTVLYADNMKLYVADAEYVLYKIAESVENNDRLLLGDWLVKASLGLQNVISSNRGFYLAELQKETETLTRESVQEIINAVNAAREGASLLQNGSFDTGVTPWRAFDIATPTAVYSDGQAVLTKSSNAISTMLSEVVDVSYGDILHLEFTAKSNRDDVQLTFTNSQFTEEELRNYGELAGASEKEAASKVFETFNITTTATSFVADIRVGSNIYGLVAALSLESGNAGDIVYIDNVTISHGTSKFVNSKLNLAIDSGNCNSFKRWMKHKNSNLVYEIIKVDEEFMSNLKTAKQEKGENLTTDEIADISESRVTDIGTRLELFVDDTLIDTEKTTAELEVMKPEFAGQILNASGGFVCDNIANEVYTGHFDPSRITEDTRPWENLGSDFGNVIYTGEKYLYYYRGVDEEVQTVDRYVNGAGNHDPSVAYYLNVCVAESTDGVTWTRPELDLYDFNYEGENLKNNIIIGDIMENFEGRHLASFCAFKDDGPNANPEKPYKAMMVTVMARGWGFDLFAFESADGIHWELMNNGESVITNGRSDIMDSMNVVLWSAEDEEYKMYFRMWQDHAEYGQQRAVATISSKDFINWTSIDTESEFLDYYSDKTNEELIERNSGYNGDHPDGYQLYTNGIQAYDRAPHVYIGMPTRYLGNKAHEVAPYLVAGRDGQNFKFWDNMLIEPSAELGRDGNRSNYSVCGVFRTSETEYSFLAARGFKDSGCIIDRFSFRVDGFVAAKGDAAGKTLVTTPVTFSGDKFILNFKAPEGTVRAQLTDVNGNALEGFTYADCTALTGDSIEQELTWTGDLATINQPVKISFELKNAELYSYKFACSEHEYESEIDTDCELCGDNRDVNGDGRYDIRDLVYVGENISSETWYKKSADKNGDGVINLKDIAIIIKRILKTKIKI